MSNAIQSKQQTKAQSKGFLNWNEEDTKISKKRQARLVLHDKRAQHQIFLNNILKSKDASQNKNIVRNTMQ